MKALRNVLFYPFLLAIYPILSLYSSNLIFVEPRNLARPLVIALLGVLALLLVSGALLKDSYKAGLLTAVATALFFSYGHFYLYLESSGVFLGRHRYLAPLWIVIFGAAAYWITRKAKNLRASTHPFNLVALFLLILPTMQIANYAARINLADTPDESAPGNPAEFIAGSAERPDIYWIIFDGYSRADVLQSHYGFDNSEFIRQLEQRGFYVAPCSQSNYSWTHFSLSSALDMQYLEDADTIPVWRETSFKKILDAQDYLVVALDNGYPKTRELNPELWIRAKDNTQLTFINTLSDFEVLLLKTTMALLLTDTETVFPERFQVDVELAIYTKHYWWTRSFFEQLGGITEREEATFVMAHFLVPHDPYVFNADGSFTSDRNIDENTGYVNQVQFVNREILETIDEILEKSPAPPVIIMQGDHGWPWTSPEERLAILNAYYLPGGGNDLLYETISPINSFRLAANEYLGYDYELLEDASYFSPEGEMNDLSVFPNSCSAQ